MRRLQHNKHTAFPTAHGKNKRKSVFWHFALFIYSFKFQKNSGKLQILVDYQLLCFTQYLACVQPLCGGRRRGGGKKENPGDNPSFLLLSVFLRTGSRGCTQATQYCDSTLNLGLQKVARINQCNAKFLV